MAKIDTKKLIKLIENLVDKLVQSKVERMVEERVHKLIPMLVEHEVNRIIKEQVGNVSTKPVQKSSGNKIVDEVMGSGEEKESNDLREHFRALVTGGKGASTNEIKNDFSRTINATSKDVHSIAAGSGNGNSIHTAPPTNPDGKPIDVSNPNVQNVMNVMNKDLGKKFKDMQERSKKRGGSLR